MLRIALANLRAHTGRLLLSSVAVVVATAFVAGTFLFTDAMRAELTSTYSQDLGQADVVVTAPSGTTEVPREVLPAVRTVDGVSGAYARIPVSDRAIVQYPSGPLVPAAIVSVASEPGWGWPTVTAGRLPAQLGQAVLDQATAQRSGLGVGETVTVHLDGLESPSQTLRVVGLVDPGESPQYAGKSFLGVSTPQAIQARALAGTDQPPSVLAAGADGVSAGQLADRVEDAVGPSYEVRTTAEHARAQVSGGQTTSVRTVLLGFAGIALFVAAIVIANTFSILLAQRTREMALLRCVGASRGQVFRSVLAESAALGLAGSTGGVVAGFGLTYLVGLGLTTWFANLPFSAVTPSATAVVVPIVVGVAVTVGAAVLPARAATRIPPVAALRDQSVPTRRSGRVRLVCAVVLLLVGATGLALGSLALSATQGFAAVFAGGVAAFLGVLLVAPVLVPPLVRLTGVVLIWVLGTPGRLATINTVRNPRRAAATTAAMLVGAMLISLLSVGAATTRATVNSELNDKFPADYMVRSEEGMPASVADNIRAIPGLSAVAVVHGTHTRLQGHQIWVSGYHPPTLATVTSEMPAIAGLAPGQVVLTEELARLLKTGPGGTVGFGDMRLAVSSILPATGAQDAGAAYLTRGDLSRIAPRAPIAGVFARQAPGADSAQLSTAIDRAAAGHEVTVVGTAQTRATYTSTLDTVLLVATALLAITMLIAVVGVANTLALSVVERSRESGLLRALGLTRRQLQATLAVEAGLLALLGALLGISLGTVFGWAAITSILGPSFTIVLAIPWLQLAGLTTLAVLAGLLASVLPARRATSASVVSAMADH